MNTRTEHDRLIELLLDYGKKVVCGFEATGNYHRPIAWRLLQAGFDVRLVSSMALARTREALHNGWDKNDPKDAHVILHMLRIGASQHYHDPLNAARRVCVQTTMAAASAERKAGPATAVRKIKVPAVIAVAAKCIARRGSVDTPSPSQSMG
jgi:transposase